MICEECIENSFAYLDQDQEGNHYIQVYISCESCGFEDDFTIPGWYSQDEMSEKIQEHYASQ